MPTLRDEIERIINKHVGYLIPDRHKESMRHALIAAILKEWPKESYPPSGSLEDKYGYLAGQRKGHNQALALCREHVEGIGRT